MKTWQAEMLVVAVALAGVASWRGEWVEWLAAAAVLATFGHASVAERLREREAARPVVSVDCHRWLGRYYVAKELLWVAFFVATEAYAALVGCAVFLAYPAWRRWWRRRRPMPAPARPRPRRRAGRHPALAGLHDPEFRRSVMIEAGVNMAANDSGPPPG